MATNNNMDGHLGKGIEIKGTLRFEGSVRIDGKFVGKVISPATLIVGPDAVVDGEIEVGEIEVHGAVRGQVKVAQKATIHASGVVEADIDTRSLVLEPGARFNGRCEMQKKEAAKPVAPAPTPGAKPAAAPPAGDEENTPQTPLPVVEEST